MRHIALALSVLSSTALASPKFLRSMTSGCIDGADLKVAPFPELKAGIRIYSNEAEFQLNFKTLSCVVHASSDAWECNYEETLSGSYQGQWKPFKATLYPSRYDLDLTGELSVINSQGKECRYAIEELD